MYEAFNGIGLSDGAGTPLVAVHGPGWLGEVAGGGNSAVEAAIAQQERAAAIENRAQYAQAMEDKKQEVEHQLTAQRAKAGKQREALCQQARKHLPEAVSAIYERVLQHGNR